MAHVRYATQGGVALENVHPFSRELWGIHWCFCHNGEVPKFCNLDQDGPRLGKTTELAYRPIGDTDSEAVFCAILNALKAEFDALPTLSVLHCFLGKLCDEIIEGHTDDTIFNFLLGCGPYTQFAYSWPGQRPGSKVWNGLHYIVREPPFTTAKLVDDDYMIDFAAVTTPSDRVAVITTKPLTCETGWTEFKRGELLMFDNGLPYSSAETCETVERQGRGLYSRCFGKGCPKQRAAMCAKFMAAAAATPTTTATTTTTIDICTANDAASDASTSGLSDCSSERLLDCEQRQQQQSPKEAIPLQTRTDCPLAAETAPVVLQAAAAAAVVATTTACLETQARQHVQPQPPVTSPSSPVCTSPVRANRIIEC